MSGGSGQTLTAELVDAITEAVAKPDDPCARASVIVSLLGEVDEALGWRHAFADNEERFSVAKVLDEAANHRLRMVELARDGHDQPR